MKEGGEMIHPIFRMKGKNGHNMASTTSRKFTMHTHDK